MKSRQHAVRSEEASRQENPAPIPNGCPEEELDWRGTLERIREEFGGGRAHDGVQRGFR
jgi:hypothetical protein